MAFDFFQSSELFLSCGLHYFHNNKHRFYFFFIWHKFELTRTLKHQYVNCRCPHYWRRCSIRTLCYDSIYSCRLCHDSLKEGQCDTAPDRRLIKKVVCSVCSKEQEASQKCNSCNVIMGAYFYAECRLFDDEVSKQHFHCDKCNICRVGGAEIFFHCLTCGCCYHKSLFKNHICHTDIIKGDCVVCQERMFESRIQIAVPRCGHPMHHRCYLEYINGNGFTCPSCLKSLFNLNRTWARIDDWNNLHAEAIIPGRYVEISCNDCGTSKSVVLHQAHAERCPRCNSYNTRREGWSSSPK